MYLQSKQLMKEVVLAKWEGGEAKKCIKVRIACDTHISSLVDDYEFRETLSIQNIPGHSRLVCGLDTSNIDYKA